MILLLARCGARSSITARLNSAVNKAITVIDESTWTPIRYPNAIFEEDENRFVSHTQVAEIGFTASRRRQSPLAG